MNYLQTSQPNSYFSQERLSHTLAHWIAEQCCDELLDAGLLSLEERMLLHEVNHETFRPLFFELFQKSLDKQSFLSD